MIGIIIFLAIVAFFVYANKERKKQEKKKIAEEQWLKDFQECYKSGDYKNIIELSEGKDLANSQQYMAVGMAHLHLGNEPLGIQFFEKAASKEGSTSYVQSKIYIKLGKTYYNLGVYDKAIKIFQNLDSEWVADRIKWGEYDVPKLLGNCFFQLKMYEAALNAYKKAPVGKRDTNHELNKIIFGIGECYEAMGNKKMALKQYQKVQANDLMFKGLEDKILVMS